MQIHIPIPEYQPNNKKIYGQKNSLDNGKSRDDGPRKNDIIKGDMKAKLKVSNLDRSVKAADMTELFSEFGKLKWTKLNRDKLGTSLGSAYIGKIIFYPISRSTNYESQIFATNFLFYCIFIR